jgi:spore coat polysaccharide biosynthesis protein SpsF
MIQAILQARVSSTRLPGKVLKPILDVPMLQRQIERIKRTEKIERFLVATSTDPTDDPIESLCREAEVGCFRGSLNDVLDRFYKAAAQYNPSHVVRLTGDCPLYDPELADKIIKQHLLGNYDYTSNTIQPTFPDGLDIEVFSFKCLEEAWREANLNSQREHVTPFINQQPNRYKLFNYTSDIDHSDLRWTVDEQRDFEFISIVYNSLYNTNPCFKTTDILDFLDKHSELREYNTIYQRNEGYKCSLDNDYMVKKEGNCDV